MEQYPIITDTNIVCIMLIGTSSSIGHNVVRFASVPLLHEDIGERIYTKASRICNFVAIRVYISQLSNN